MERWISVKERLPEDNEEVICANIENGRVFALEYSRGEFRFDGEIYTHIVTHWMPLPEPPTENRE